MSELDQFHGPNAGYVLDLYDRFLADPESVDPETRATFSKWRPDGLEAPHRNGVKPSTEASRSAAMPPQIDVTTVVHAARVARMVRELGHLTAHIDPLGSTPPGDPGLELSADLIVPFRCADILDVLGTVVTHQFRPFREHGGKKVLAKIERSLSLNGRPAL